MTEIPKNIKRTMKVVMCTDTIFAGQIKIMENAWEDSVVLTTFDVDIDIPNEIDIKKKYIAVLEKKKKGIQAKYHMRLKEVQDEIDSMLAIEGKS